MSAELLRTLSVVAFSIAAGALIVGVILWFTLNISNVIGFLSGRNVKRATETLTGEVGRTIYKRPNVNMAKKEPSNKTEPVKKKKSEKKPEKKRAVPEAEPTIALEERDAVAPTTLLYTEPTTALSEGTMLLDASGIVEGTTLLDDVNEVEGTTLLTTDEEKYSDFVITASIVMVHTDERIKL